MKVRACQEGALSLWELLGLGAPEETAWMVDALCAQTDPDAFHPAPGESLRAAKSVCLACPVRAECLAYALDHNERHGVWGGTSPNERAQVRRVPTPMVPLITRPGAHSAKSARQAGAPNHLQGSGENPMVENVSASRVEGEVA
jgi:WhiB family redox-sensing transcriptional regulator